MILRYHGRAERSAKSVKREMGVIDLITLRSLQINGCGFCLDMHWKGLRAAGRDVLLRIQAVTSKSSSEVCDT